MSTPSHEVTPDAVNAFVDQQWPQRPYRAECLEVSRSHSLASMRVDDSQVRPGGFISGPMQFAAADMVLWFACFGAIGLEAMAMTSELSIRFLRPASGRLLTARADLNSVGSRSIVGSVTIWTDDPGRPTSVCQGTYAVPRH